MTITVVQGDPPTIVPSFSAVTVIPLQRLTMNVTVTGPGGRVPSLLWSSPSLTDAALSSAQLSSSRSQSFLSLLVTMPPGVYRFVLTATLGSVSAATTIVVTVNQAPRNGYLSVSPANGTALATQFVVTTAGWSGDATVRDCQRLCTGDVGGT